MAPRHVAAGKDHDGQDRADRDRGKAKHCVPWPNDDHRNGEHQEKRTNALVSVLHTYAPCSDR